MLFEDENATDPLQDYLLEHYAGQTVPIERDRRDVIAKTPFHSGQVKRQTLAPMQREGRSARSGRQTECTYPDGVVVVFPA